MILLAIAASCSPGDAGPPPVVRKNTKVLTAEEKKVFTDAVLALKNTPPPDGITDIVINDEVTISFDNYYDMFVAFHQACVMRSVLLLEGRGIAHKNASFLPWHRKLLRLFELALNEVAREPVALPYWDWTDPESTAAAFSPDLLGSGGDPNCTPDCAYAVTDGPFQKDAWTINIPTRMAAYVSRHPWTWIVRAFDRHENETYAVVLPTTAEVQEALAIDTYDTPPYDNSVSRMASFRNYLEGFDPPTDNQYMHNVVHDWVSGGWIDSASGQLYVGTMEPLDISPSDPAFFLHHANVDRIWASWQRVASERMSVYAPVSGAHEGWNKNDPMYPYSLYPEVPQIGESITPGEQLDVEAMGFTYDAFVE